MKLRTTALIALAALATASLAACSPSVAFGPPASTSPEIADVAAVHLDTNGDLTISEGEPSLTITAPAGILDRFTAEVHDGVLVLGRTGGPLTVVGKVTYELTLPSLESVVVNGSGDVRSTVSADTLSIEIVGSGDVAVTGLDASDVRIAISGSGDVELFGTTGSVSVELGGSGEVDVADLVARDAVVAVTGSGDVEVHATGSLRVEVSGSGDVRYSGPAEVEAEVTGSGDVERAD